ncbi:hypothetical protein BDL97_13G084700 [Sphagnum fallax]|nr:hypothetical protein BDL97_13G084700 [Sphagnum fallax]
MLASSLLWCSLCTKMKLWFSKGAQEIVMRQQRSGPSSSFFLVKKLRDDGYASYSQGACSLFSFNQSEIWGTQISNVVKHFISLWRTTCSSCVDCVFCTHQEV